MPAPNRTKTEHVGQLKKVVFESEAGDFAILALACDSRILVNDAAGRFAPGIYYRFLGRWEEGNRGPQFRASTWVADRPAGRNGVMRWLAEHCPGIGPATARKLADQYDTDAVRVVREEPERAVADGILDPTTARAAAAALAGVAGQERTRLELWSLFEGKGFPRATVNRVVSKWGAKAPAVVRADPFRLLTAGLPGCGWQRCDRLYLDLGGRRDKMKRQAVAGWAAVRDDRSGSTWVPADVAIAGIKAAVPNGSDPIRALKVAIRAGRLQLKRDGAERWLAVADRARAEQRVADAVARLLDGPSHWPTGFVDLERDGPAFPSAHQLDELRKATTTPVGCFTGGPGTGKTHTLAFLLRAIVAEFGPDSVAVCAPTGKAAVRAGESLAACGVALRPLTIHALLGVGGGSGDGDGWEFTHNRNKPLSYRFIVADEGSMIDASLMASLLDALVAPQTVPASPALTIPAGAPIPPACRRCGRPLTNPDSWAIGFGPECRKHVDPSEFAPVAPTTAEVETVIPERAAYSLAGTCVLFVGDPYQLPPVGHGAPLRDLIASGRVGVGELTEIRRNAGTVVRACADIKAGRPMTTAPRFDLDAETPENLRVLDVPVDAILDTLEDVLAKLVRFDPVADAQVILPLNEKSPVSRKAVNERLARSLNPFGRRVTGSPFATGDKVICLKNGKLKAVEPAGTFGDPDMAEAVGNYNPTPDDRQVYVANGEPGRVVAVGPKSFVADFDGGRLVSVPVRPVRDAGESDGAEGGGGGAAGDFDLAYAITVHKSQGSEWPLVIAIIDPAGGGVADAHFWYTAISRARLACLLIGPAAALSQQISRKSLARRKTYLAELIRESATADR
jgi:hypothetical protein